MKSPAIEGRRKREQSYVLDDQVGFLSASGAPASHDDFRYRNDRGPYADPVGGARQTEGTRRLLAKSSRPPDRDGRRHDQGRDRSPDRSRLHHDRSGPARRPPSPRRADAGGRRSFTNARRRSLRSSLKRRSSRWTNTNARRSSLCCGGCLEAEHPSLLPACGEGYNILHSGGSNVVIAGPSEATASRSTEGSHSTFRDGRSCRVSHCANGFCLTFRAESERGGNIRARMEFGSCATIHRAL